MSPQIAAFPEGIQAHMTWFLGSSGVLNPNGIWICSAVLAQFMVVTNRQTHRPRYIYSSRPPHLCIACMRCGLIVCKLSAVSALSMMTDVVYGLQVRSETLLLVKSATNDVRRLCHQMKKNKVGSPSKSDTASQPVCTRQLLTGSAVDHSRLLFVDI